MYARAQNIGRPEETTALIQEEGGRKLTANKRKKPQLEYIDKSMTVNGKWTKEHTQAVKAADRIFNSQLS